MILINGLGYLRASDTADIETVTTPDMVVNNPPQPNVNEDEYDVDDDDTESYIQPTVANKISLARSYFLCITLGFLGAHYYYLGRRTEGLLYTATLGFFGIGWIVDWFRLPSLVEGVRSNRREEAENGYALFAVPYGELQERSVITAYLYCIPPWGFFGIHHMYLGTFRKNDVFHLLYIATLGFVGFGWLFDIFRIPILVRRANEDIRDLRSGIVVSSDVSNTQHLDTAYMLAFPLGVFGLHHFYMRRYFYGLIYMISLGLAGVGVLIDLFRLPFIFKRNRREHKDLRFSLYHMDDAYILWFPLGLLGLHHFYLRNWKMGVAYLCTFGFVGVGWMIDAFRMRSLVEDSNKKLDTDLLWDHVFTTGSKSRGNTNIFVHNKLYNYPITDEDGNIQVYAFPLQPNGKPSWLLGWAWSPSLTSRNGLSTSDELNDVERHRTPLVDEPRETAFGWAVDPHENYEVSIA